MISIDQALDILHATAKTRNLKTTEIDLKDAVGSICAADMNAPLAIQPFDNSAMDGFAVYCQDLQNASDNNPVCLQRSGIIAAGNAVSDQKLSVGTCAHIMTGAPMPPGADGIVPIENVSIDGDQITFTGPAIPGRFIRKAGADFQKGQLIVRKGDLMQAQHILPLAAQGIARIPVLQKPKAVFFSTGDELVNDLSLPLQSGQIYNANSYFAGAMLPALGADLVHNLTLKDDKRAFTDLLHQVMDEETDLVISSGAVSAGAFDFVKDGLIDIGAEILYHKIRMRPGKPNLFARLPNGALYFGLPGNPVSTAMGLRLFVYAAIRAMTLRGPEDFSPAILQNDFAKKPGFQMYLKALSHIDTNGQLLAEIMPGQESFKVSPFLTMDGWVVAKQDSDGLRRGDKVDYYPFLP